MASIPGEKQRMVFGASTYRLFAPLLASGAEQSEAGDPWVTRMRNLPATVVSTTLHGPLDWPDATAVPGDADPACLSPFSHHRVRRLAS